MRKSKFSDEQKVLAVKEIEAGAKVEEVARRLGVSAHTLYRWRAIFSGIDVSEARRLRQLEDENRRLKAMVADLSLDLQAVKFLLSKKF